VWRRKSSVVTSIPQFNDVPDAEAFRTCNGVIIRNLFELKNYLDGCSDYDFRYHVNNDHHKNDFAIWVREAIHDDALASELDFTLDLGEYKRKINMRLKEME
jgi:hypothetical protein